MSDRKLANEETFSKPATVDNIQTKLALQFKCLGEECGLTCCNGWNIHIDKKTHLLYRKSLDPEVKEISKTALKRDRTEAKNHSTVILKDNGDCPYLDTDKLCKVQKNLGEKALSHTCSTFPRLYSQRQDTELGIFLGLDLGCPAAAKNLVSDEHSTDLVDIPITEAQRVVHDRRILLNSTKPEGNVKVNNSINGVFNAIARDPEISSFSKYMSMHLVLNNLISNESILGETSNLFDLAAIYREKAMVFDEVMVKERNSFRSLEYVVQAASLHSLTLTKLFQDFVREALDNIKFDPASIGNSTEVFDCAMGLYKSEIKNRNKFEINFLASEILLRRQASEDLRKFEQDLDVVFMRVAIIRFISGCLLLERKKLTDDELALIVATTCRTVVFGKKGATQIILEKRFKQTGDKLATFGILLNA